MLLNCQLEKTLENPLDSKEIKPVNLKGNQPWILIGGTDAEAPILWPSEANSLLTGKGPDAKKDWRQKEKGVTEDKMVGWHHWCNRYELGQIPRDDGGQGFRRVGHDLATEQQHIRPPDTQVPSGAGKVMSLLFNMLFRLVIAFLHRSKEVQGSFKFIVTVIICSDFGAQKYKVSHCFYYFPIYFLWRDETKYDDLSLLNVEF